MGYLTKSFSMTDRVTERMTSMGCMTSLQYKQARTKGTGKKTKFSIPC